MAAGEKKRKGKKPTLVIHHMADGSTLYNDEIFDYPLPYGFPRITARLRLQIMMSETPAEREERLAKETAQKAAGNA